MTVGQSQGLLLHDLAGRPITELNSTGGFNRGEIYANGGRLATYANSTTYFDYADGLGTTRMTATLAGLEQSACISWPYGAGLNCSASAPSPMHFTGQVQKTGGPFPGFHAHSWIGKCSRAAPGGDFV